MALKHRLSALLLSLLACDVPEPPASTGGVSLPDGPCGRGLVVIGSNASASNVALMDLTGGVRSASLLSSGSAAAGLSLPLSGDVVAPSERTGELVLLDRYPNAVITWASPATGAVRAQLTVTTGFPSNPQDYLPIAPDRAYVSRHNTSLQPGAEPFDGGGDVLIVAPQQPAITGRIAFSEPAPYLPRPARMIRVGGDAWLTLLRFTVDFTQALDSSLVGIDTATDQERWRMELPGLANCSALARTDDGARVAVSCSGVFLDPPAAQLARSGVVVLDATTTPPTEVRRLSGATLGASPSLASPAFVSGERLLVPLVGDGELGTADRLVEITVATGAVRVVHESTVAFVLGDVRCATPCEERCYLADGEAPGVRPLLTGGGQITAGAPIEVAPERGLRPVYLGRFLAGGVIRGPSFGISGLPGGGFSADTLGE